MTGLTIDCRKSSAKDKQERRQRVNLPNSSLALEQRIRYPFNKTVEEGEDKICLI
jgi:hypothetical protein